MFAVFVAFTTVPNPIVKPLAFTLAVGVLLDAFVIRLTLIPAVMALIGNRMWYHPRWFGRLVPDLDIEGAELEHRLAAAVEPEVRQTVPDQHGGFVHVVSAPPGVRRADHPDADRRRGSCPAVRGAVQRGTDPAGGALRTMLVEFEPRHSVTVDRAGLALAPAHETISKRAAVGLDRTPVFLVRAVEPAPPAARAGLRAGDVLIRLDGSELRSRSRLDDILHENAPQLMELAMLRGEGQVAIHLPPQEEASGRRARHEAARVQACGLVAVFRVG